MTRVLAMMGAVVVSTVLFLFFKNIKMLENEKDRAIAEVKQIREDIENVSKIKIDNSTSTIDYIERLRSKGYLRD